MDRHQPLPCVEESQEVESKGETSSLVSSAVAEDGYNWRKYGQKQVKGSEYPRSYYKCTNMNCHVKKKVERDHEGHVTEIIYKGTHNHQKPVPVHRPGFPSSSSNDLSQVDHHDSSTISNDPAEVNPELDVSSTNGEDEDLVTHENASLDYDGEDEESEAKKRKLDAYAIEMSTGSRAAREHKVVVQTTSEVDILDDGYRWRKYGQKVVKGNPNPRSYYKCTHPSCTVRKHVERASHDLKAVITTYEGKHNHEVPVSRSGSGAPINSVAPPFTTAPSTTQPSRLQNGFPRFDTPAPFPTAANFSFAIGPQGLPMSNLAMANFRSMDLPPANMYIGQHRVATEGLLVPKGEPKEDVVSNKMPLGP